MKIFNIHEQGRCDDLCDSDLFCVYGIININSLANSERGLKYDTSECTYGTAVLVVPGVSELENPADATCDMHNRKTAGYSFVVVTDTRFNRQERGSFYEQNKVKSILLLGSTPILSAYY